METIRSRRAAPHRTAPAACALAVALALAGCGGSDDDAGNGGAGGGTGAGASLEVKAVSAARPDMVTGGDVLLEIPVPDGIAPAAIRVTADGQDVTARLAHDAQAKVLRGVVTGLANGDNTIVVSTAAGARGELKVVNHPITGPVFSGPKLAPFACQTAQFRLYAGGPLLGAPTDADCSVATRVDYLYRAADNTFKALDPAAALPADLKQTTTRDGATVPYIVRLETGTINRAIYQTAVLHDPKGEPAVGPSAAPKGWNRRLVYAFGGGCGSGWYRQGATVGPIVDDALLSQGYGVATSSLNVFGNNCNDVLSAETAMMVKERFVETYGRPRYTIGWSCSGAAMQQYLIADNYPGILDGIVPSCSFPDPSNPASSDARLLYNYYNFGKALPWTEGEIASASGYWGYQHLVNQNSVWASRLDAIPNRPNGYTSALFNAAVPAGLRFDPVDNPTGARPTHWDWTVNVFGRDPATGFARRAMDNVGVQYGLGALNDGRITKAQFLDLNERIGGYDINGTFTPQRTQGDSEGIRIAHQTGRILNGGGGLASTPILDWDQLDTEELPTGDLHLKFFHYMTRARLVKANGNAANMVMWNGGSIDTAFVGQQALARMDDWLARVVADASAGSLRDKVIRNKPADLVDGCWRRTAPGTAPVFVAEPQFLGTRGTSQCNSLYPGYSYPRGVAGEPAASDIVKCQLKPVTPTDYKPVFAAAELDRLRAVFPQGVCDYSKPGVEQRPLARTWLRYPEPGRFVVSP